MTDLLAAVRWWAALTMLGLIALPLLYSLLRPLPDRGYAFVKPAGLLLVSYVFWLFGSFGLLGNNGGGILAALLGVGALSLLAYRRRPADDAPLGAWLRANWRTVIVIELLFAGVFALWVWVRAQNPAITATEKPMEFAFLNGVGRSPAFPPIDPWLSGYSISYYYFGYVMSSLLSRLALVTEAVAFNLTIAWIVAGTATGAFGMVYNLILTRVSSDELRVTSSEPSSDLVPRHPSLVTRALLMGLIAALAVPIAGNLQIGLEVLHGNGVGSDDFWQWLDVRDINGPATAEEPPRYQTTNWWWWRTSRVIHEYHLSGRAEEGLEPIVEVPAFSFVLGDMHPHVLALPFAFLSLAVALAWYRRVGSYELQVTKEADKTAGIVAARVRQLLAPVGWPLWLFTVIVLGGLSFLNTWDVLIHLFVILGAFWLGGYVRQGNARELWGRAAALAVLLVAAVVLLYLPFYLGFRSQAGAPFLLPMLMRPTRLAHYFIIFGGPLLCLSAWLVTLAARNRFHHWRSGLGAAVGVVGGLFLLSLFLMWLIASTAPGGGMTGDVARELGLSLPTRPVGSIAPGWGLRLVVAVLPAWLGARLASPWLALLLAGLLALVVMALRTWGEEETPPISQLTQITEVTTAQAVVGGRWSAVTRHSSLPFVLLLVLTAVLLTIGPEFVYLRDNFGVRLNTTFKFYYQAWGMFGIAAVFALDYLLSLRRRVGRVVGTAVAAGYLALLAVALLFPVYAVQSRAAEYRGPARAPDGTALERQPATLDGLAYLRRSNAPEYDALQWLRANAVLTGEAPPVVLEAVGGQYSGFGRVSANTGLPTVLGWPGHEWQWRGSDHPEPGRREPIVEQIYTTPDLGVVGFLLDQFDVAYIYVGELEASTYGAAGLEKFRDRLPVAYENERVTIYRWQPAGAN